MSEPLGLVLLGGLISGSSLWLDGVARWGALGVGLPLLVVGIAWLIASARRMGRTADAWRKR